MNSMQKGKMLKNMQKKNIILIILL